MLVFSVIQNTETEKDVAVVVHDTKSSRVVWKTLDSSLEKALSLHYDRSVIVQEPKEINGAIVQVRRRAVPKDEDYLSSLLDKAIKSPYIVRDTGKLISGHQKIDSFLDSLSKERLAQVSRKELYIERVGTSSSGKTVWIIDGEWVRKNKDSDFTDMGQHLKWNFIPDNEYWLDEGVNPEERPIKIKHLEIEEYLMSKGVDYDTARSEGYKVERIEREKLFPVPDLAHLKLEELGIVGNKKIVLVDGEKVRNLYPRFKEGGHFLVYPFIPEDEIWIDNDLTAGKRKPTIKHEVEENRLMTQGWPYLAAHTQALPLEQEIRTSPLKKIEVIPVPFERQSEAYSCGASALQSVLGYYGNIVKEDALILELGTDKEEGTYPENIVEVARNYGLVAGVLEDLTLQELEQFVKWSIPVIVAYQAWREGEGKPYSSDWGDGHYSTVIGLDSRNVYLDDPAQFGIVGYLSKEDFLARWHDVDSKGNKRVRLGIPVMEGSNVV
jgi:predicted double-glycine peptidase